MTISSKADIVTTIADYVGEDIAPEMESRYRRYFDVKECLFNTFISDLHGLFIETVVGKCQVKIRATKETLDAYITHYDVNAHSIYSMDRMSAFTVRLVQDNVSIGTMKLRFFTRPKGADWEGYAYNQLLKRDYEGAVEIARMYGGHVDGSYRGAGSALFQVAAEIAQSRAWGLIVEGTGDSWKFWVNKMKMTAGEGVQVNGYGGQTFALDKQGWEFIQPKLEAHPILCSRP